MRSRRIYARAHVSRPRRFRKVHTKDSRTSQRHACISTSSTTPSREQPASGSSRLSFTPKRAVTLPRTDVRSSGLLFYGSLRFLNAIPRAQPYVELATCNGHTTVSSALTCCTKSWNRNLHGLRGLGRLVSCGRSCNTAAYTRFPACLIHDDRAPPIATGITRW
jgi:hypothetical protein